MRLSLIAATMVVALASAAASASPAQRVYTFAISLDGDGRLQTLSPHGFTPDDTSRALEQDVRGWVFAGRAPGAAPVARTSYLRVVVDDLDGVVSATTGPAPAQLGMPEYPVRDQLASRHGTVVLRLAIAADGSVGAAEVHDVHGSVSRPMAAAAMRAARDWSFSPETIGGQAVAATMLWPVCYLGPQADTGDCAWTGPDAQRFSSQTVLAIEPAVRLTRPLALGDR